MKKGSIDSIQIGDYILTVYRPPSYGDDGGFPVLYMQDGGKLFLDTLDTIESLFQGKMLAEMLMVGITPHKRLDEYTPWRSPALDCRYQNFGGQGEAYLDFLVQEIKPFIDGRYCTLPERENTGIMGFSLGGLISMFAVYLYSDIFGRLGSLSGSFWYEGFLDYLRCADISHIERRIYIDVGELEGKHKSSIQRNMLENTSQIPMILYKQNLNPHDCCFIIEKGVDHGYLHFIKRFPGAIQWLFPCKI